MGWAFCYFLPFSFTSPAQGGWSCNWGIFILFFFSYLCCSDLKSEFSPCSHRESHRADAEPVCSRALGELLLKGILKWGFFWHWALLGARDAQRGLKPPWLCCDSAERSGRVSFPAALLSPEPRGQPELSPQEPLELQELRFQSRAALTHHGRVCTPQGKVSFCLWWAGAGAAKPQCWTGCGWGGRFGDRLRTETASNFTTSSEIPAFPKSQRKEQQQGLSRTPVLLSGTGIPQF